MRLATVQDIHVHVRCIVQLLIHKIGYMKYDNYSKIGNTVLTCSLELKPQSE